MNDNRKIDALVAEHVFGTQVRFLYRFDSQEDSSVRFLASPETPYDFYRADDGDYYQCPPPGIPIHGYKRIPSYSTDIAFAWQVVEKLKAEGYMVSIDTAPGFGNAVSILKVNGKGRWEDQVGCISSTLPEALTRAALKLKGAEV